MLREILTNGYVDKNINLSKKTISPTKPNESKVKKNPSFTQLNLYPNKKEMNISNKPIFEEKIEMIKKRPDYILNQNNESTNPTLNNNKLLLYSNEITKNIKSPKYMNNINMKGIYKDNEYFDVDELDSNNNISNNNTNTKLSKKNKNSSINTPYQDNKFFNANNEKIDKKVKEETDQNIEFNMTMLTPEGIDKIKLLNEYINQIKENSNKINENKILELQSQKEQLEYNVKYLTNNIILTKKKYNDNVKTEKNLLAEKEKVGFDKKKANKDAFTLQKELPNNRVEIEIMKNRITQTKEETKNINNYYYEIERQTNEIQDEIKKINVKISASIKEKDKIMNEINAIKKKNSIIRNKIYKVENSANEFLFNVGQLAKSTQSIKIK
jgi:hypothetical protein